MDCIEVNEPLGVNKLSHAVAPAGSSCSRPSAFHAVGCTIDTVVLRNRNGVCAEVTNLGAALSGMWVPDRNGVLADVVLGHADRDARMAGREYFGSSVGRVAGRISGARFSLDGREFRLSSNTAGVCLHGGSSGFDTLVWRWLAVEGNSVRLQLTSEDGDQGFPGKLIVEVEYRLDDEDELLVEYSATCDRPTVVNLTHHPFWNLAGEGAGRVDGHELTLFASSVAVLDQALIPTGELRPVQGTAFDFRTSRAIGEGMGVTTDPQLQMAGGFDHYWVGEGVEEMRLVARLYEPDSGRVLEVLSNQPGIQFYSGNFLDGSVVGKSGGRYYAHHGLCLEPQAFPDAVSRPEFPSIRLDPGRTYRNGIRYRFGHVPMRSGSTPGSRNQQHATTGRTR